MDVGAQFGSMTCFDKKMSVAVDWRSELLPFLGSALISAIFVSCRSLNYIVHLYVTANSFYKTSPWWLQYIQQVSCILFSHSFVCLRVEYFVLHPVYPELRRWSKRDSFLLYGASLPCLVWIVMNVIHVFSVFYDTEMLPILFSLLQCAFYLLAFAATDRWMFIVRERQNVGRFCLDILTTEEYTFLQYWIPSLLYAPAVVL